MATLLILAVVAIVAILSVMAMSGQQDTSATPFDELSVPKVGDGAEVPLVFGPVWIKSSGVADYGDYRTRKIKG